MGGILVSWNPLPDHCRPSDDGIILTDGSVGTCPKGEDLPLKNYKIYYRLSTEAGTYSSILVEGGTRNYLVSGLEKGQDYNFQVSAVNSEKESILSETQVNKTLVTVPGPPPPPQMNGASPQSLRISWTEPEDSGASPRLKLPMSAFQVSFCGPFRYPFVILWGSFCDPLRDLFVRSFLLTDSGRLT